MHAMTNDAKEPNEAGAVEPQEEAATDPAKKKKPLKEIGGPSGPEPTRYGDWEKKGRCIDF